MSYNKEVQKRFYWNHRDARLLESKIWREKNKTRRKIYMAQYGKVYWIKNKAKRLEYSKIWRKEHPGYAAERSAEWRKRNLIKSRLYQNNYRKKWCKTVKGRENMVVQSARRRGWIKNNGKFTRVEWHNLKTKWNFSCLKCKRKEPEILLVPDHIIPLSKGGRNLISNIQPLCSQCNGHKRDKIADYR